MRTYLREYFTNNSIEFFKLIIILATTVVVSILTINNTKDSQKKDIKQFIDNKIKIIKTSEEVDKFGNFKSNFSFKIKEFLAVTLLASSFIGLPIAYFLIVKRIFSIGYTISAVFATQKLRTSIIFICNLLLLHNIIYIVSLFIVLVSGINFIKSILKKGKNTLKFEILRYLVFVFLGIGIVMISAIFETYISINLTYLLKKYL